MGEGKLALSAPECEALTAGPANANGTARDAAAELAQRSDPQHWAVSGCGLCALKVRESAILP
jgi:hypothetical protein